MSKPKREQLDEWLDLLGKDANEQRDAILDLLRHSYEDRMSNEDYEFCKRAIRRLGVKYD